MDNLVSIVLPARNEQYLTQTIRDLLDKAHGEIEIIASMDDCNPDEIVKDERVFYYQHQGHGKRQSMNEGAAFAKGEYLFFLDAHCMVSPGFDKHLKADCDDNWVVTPRRYKLEPETWTVEDNPKYPVDYMYICYPPKNPNKPTLDGFPWRERAEARARILIDDDMINQGSACFMTARHYKRMGFMQTDGYGGNFQEAQEICLSTWLSGGRVVVNKKCWYAHWRKRHRGWDMDTAECEAGWKYSTDYWMNNRWEGRIHDFAWLIEKFYPVPTWSEEWLLKSRS